MSIKLRKSKSKGLETLKSATVAAFVKTYTLANVFWNTQEECCKMFKCWPKICASCVLCYTKDNCKAC